MFGEGEISICVPAGGGDDDDGSSAAFEGRLDGSDGRDLCGVGAQRGQATQLFKQLLMKDGRLSLTAYLKHTVRQWS